MDEQRLGNFLAVVEHRHFTRAADARNIAQSGLSTSIKSLERELGVKLFERHTRRVELTSAGEAFVPEAKGVLQAIERARSAAAAGARGLRGSINLGILHGLTPSPTLATVAEFARRHQEVELHLRGPGPGGSTTHMEDVAAGRLDLAVVMSVGEVPGVHLHHVARDEVVLACGPGCDIPDNDGAVNLRDVPLNTLIDFPRGWGVRNAVDRVFSGIGVVNRNARVEINDLVTILDLVRNGLGVAFVPSSLIDQHPELRFLWVNDARPEYRVSIATGERLEANRAAARLATLLTAESSR